MRPVTTFFHPSKQILQSYLWTDEFIFNSTNFGALYHASFCRFLDNACQTGGSYKILASLVVFTPPMSVGWQTILLMGMLTSQKAYDHFVSNLCFLNFVCFPLSPFDVGNICTCTTQLSPDILCILDTSTIHTPNPPKKYATHRFDLFM